MTSYLASLAERRKKESAAELLWEVEKAFDEAEPASSARLVPRAQALCELVRFTQCDAIAAWLEHERDALERALAFARKIEDANIAGLLEGALSGRPEPAPVFSVGLPGRAPEVLAVDAGDATRLDGVDWGGTDLALSFAMEDFEEAVLDELIDAADEFELQPPRSVRARKIADAAVANSGAAQSAAGLFGRIVSAPDPRIEAGTSEQVDERAFGQGVELPVRHLLNGPAAADALAAAERKFGAAAKPLLEIYAMHDGGELFRYEDECGFYLGPISAWEELHARAIEWAEGVTWQGEAEEIPAYLYSAIAFGMIPGDSERWLLITEGEHAGKIMLSDTDVIEDEPRFENIAQFMSALLNDTGRILGSGGYVRYSVNGVELFPLRYIAG